MVGLAAGACSSEPRSVETVAPAASDGDWFVDRAAAAGLHFSYFNGMSGSYYFPEMLPGGVALLDYRVDVENVAHIETVETATSHGHKQNLLRQLKEEKYLGRKKDLH